MQAIMETIFDIGYLAAVITLGFIMLIKNKGSKKYAAFGVMALILGFGDAFHLLPRVYSLITDTMAQNYAALGFGKLVTSITMTVFYVLLYHIWCAHYKVGGRKWIGIIVYSLAAIRIALCLFPQNGWLLENSSYAWGIYRNIPFALLGALITAIFFAERKKRSIDAFSFAWLAILLSFVFYAPVVLFADSIPLMGMMMLPKTVCYLWLVLMGFGEYRKA